MMLCSTSIALHAISELSSDGGDKVMLSLMGALWFSLVTSGVIGHRLYFSPSQHRFKFLASKAWSIHMSVILFFNFMRGKTDMLYVFWHCK